MSFFVRGCKLNACRYYSRVGNKVKLLQSWFPLLLNLNRMFPYISCKFFSLKTNLILDNASVKKYMNYIMDAYKSNDKKIESIGEILKMSSLRTLLDEKLQIIENIESLSDLATNNEEMKELVKEEESTFRDQLLLIDEKMLDVILQNICNETYENVIMEIKPGVGGQEAMLFTGDLLNMYTGYLDYLGLEYEVMELIKSDIGGLRKATMLINGTKGFEKVRYEGGVHRVQRVPVTEKAGRVHTSTASVAILPQPKNVDVSLNETDLKIQTKRSSGAGGQHVNTTESAIRVTHVPTGISVTCQIHRTQLRNKEWAIMKLKSVIYEQELSKQTSFIINLRKKQIGLGTRNEKIRTYNYNRNQITDHRVPSCAISNLKEFMKGGPALEGLQEELHQDMQQKILLELVQKMESELK